MERLIRSMRSNSVGTVLVSFLLGTSSLAQLSTTSLRGNVADPAGAVINGAQMTLANPAAGFSRTASTNERASL